MRSAELIGTIREQVERYESVGYFGGTWDTIDPELLTDQLQGSFLNVSEYPTVRDAVAMQDADLPALVTFPETTLSIEKRLQITGNRAFLPSKEMRNRTHWDIEPRMPYLLLGVKIGREYLGKNARQARSMAYHVGRRGLRLSELIDLSVQNPEILDHTKGVRGLYAAETLHELNGTTTILDLYQYGDSLKVKRDPEDINDPQWTTPTYSQRVIVA